VILLLLLQITLSTIIETKISCNKEKKTPIHPSTIIITAIYPQVILVMLEGVRDLKTIFNFSELFDDVLNAVYRVK